MRIALHGYSGSGKSAARDYLAKRHGFQIISTGEICRAIARLLFGAEDKQNLHRISEALRTIDPDIFIDAGLRGWNHERTVFDSARYASDLERLRREGFKVLRIEASIDICMQRLQARGQSVRREDFSHASESEAASMLFDFVVPNEDVGLGEMHRRLDEIVIALSGANSA